jgi:hypothetical protein
MMIPIVMGLTISLYVQCFNSTMKLYKESGYTLSYRELIEKRLQQFIG